jgi:hypothetical protein
MYRSEFDSKFLRSLKQALLLPWIHVPVINAWHIQIDKTQMARSADFTAEQNPKNVLLPITRRHCKAHRYIHLGSPTLQIAIFACYWSKFLDRYFPSFWLPFSTAYHAIKLNKDTFWCSGAVMWHRQSGRVPPRLWSNSSDQNRVQIEWNWINLVGRNGLVTWRSSEEAQAPNIFARYSEYAYS